MRVRRALHSVISRRWLPSPKPVILMYHRIANDPVDPWGLCVSPIHFEEQLHVLRRSRAPLPLKDFVRHLLAGTLPAHAVALTFDDGYADNWFAGKPRLAAADVPATVFLATGYLNRPEEFWWDELARLILLDECARSFEVVVRGDAMHFEFGPQSPARDTDTWRAWSAPLTRRQQALFSIWQALRPLKDEERQTLMTGIRSTFEDGHTEPTLARAMTFEEVRALVTDGLVTIGAHTVTHPPLTRLDAGARRREIIESKVTCEALLGAQVPGFAYPYGDLDGEVCSAIGGAGFAYACSTRHGPVTAASDILALPRIQVLDWDGDAFGQALSSSAARSNRASRGWIVARKIKNRLTVRIYS
jgi:peptidoglycan/xylan/chitin deacetylase (PgdA/CDA1 family)